MDAIDVAAQRQFDDCVRIRLQEAADAAGRAMKEAMHIDWWLMQIQESVLHLLAELASLGLRPCVYAQFT